MISQRILTMALAGTLGAAAASRPTDAQAQAQALPTPRAPPLGTGRIAPGCPADTAPQTIEIREANPDVNRAAHNQQRARLFKELQVANRTVLLGPNVVLDFSDAPDLLPLIFGPCVTLTSVAAFTPDTVVSARASGRASARGAVGSSVLTPAGPARTPHSLGPLLKFGSHPQKKGLQFLMVECQPDKQPSDHVRISGFRLQGPSLGQQDIDQYGIFIERCLDIEVSNMEIFGWGGAGVYVLDDKAGSHGPGQEPPNNRPGDRIGRPEQVRILNNYIHHNQHAAEGVFSGHATGYGVNVHHGAWAQIYFNLFDVNRHAIKASGKMGGYDARWNLTLKGGGYHGTTFHKYTHQFDIHGTGGKGVGGQAGVQAWFFENSFQYRNGPAINIRGRPHIEINIGDNVFPHKGLEDDSGDDAIHLNDRDDLDVIKLRSGNVINVDTYGRYGVCDFDGDRIDDLFLATGKTWWFSSFGEFPWSYLTARTERLEQVRLGYFDNDLKCDVLTQSGDRWVISSGGTGPWTSIGAFGAQLADVAFGQFDPAHSDHRPEATRRTTHAFRRLPNGRWQVTPLSGPAWVNGQSSSFPMSKLRFGDFTGDGVTDVLAVNGGRWAISESARGAWRQLNPNLGDDVSGLFIADLNHDNIDDLLKLDVQVALPGRRIRYTWYVSEDGRAPWRKVKQYTWEGSQPVLSGRAFAGRFGVAPGGGVLLIGPDRIGNFFSPAERVAGASPDWRSLFGY
jgi:hypothetical protein